MEIFWDFGPMKHRFAIAGCGHIAQRHARNIARVGQLAAVCDVAPERADALAAAYDAVQVYDFNDLLTRPIDVVSLCTPNYLHASQAIRALEAGMHVLCEKPMAIHAADARAMLQARDKTGKMLFVVKQNRFNPPVLFLRESIVTGDLGAIHSFQVNCFWNRPPSYYQESDWKGRPDKDGGILLTQFSHFIDLICWLFGDMDAVKGFAGNFLLRDHLDTEDTGVVALKTKQGAIGSLHYTVTSHHHNMEGSITVFGEKGTIKVGGQYLNELQYYSVAGRTAPDRKSTV